MTLLLFLTVSYSIDPQGGTAKKCEILTFDVTWYDNWPHLLGGILHLHIVCLTVGIRYSVYLSYFPEIILIVFHQENYCNNEKLGFLMEREQLLISLINHNITDSITLKNVRVGPEVVFKMGSTSATLLNLF